MNTRPLCAMPPLLLLSATVNAAEIDFSAIKNNNFAIKTHIQAGFEQLNDNEKALNHKNVLHENDATIQKIDNDVLTRNPELFHQVMLHAINSREPKLLQALTDGYRQLPQANLQILRRSDGALARWRGDYRNAIKIHRDLQRDFPHDSRIALDTAAILFEDKQWIESKKQFQAAQKTFSLPENVNRNVAHYLHHIALHNKWQINGGIHFAHHVNVNRAAPEYCTPIGCQNEKPINAMALNYRLNINKNTPLFGNHNLVWRTQFSGSNHYLAQKSQYDSAFGRTHLGWQHQNAKNGLNVLPFYQWQLAGSDEFDYLPVKNKTLKMNMLSHAAGVQITATRQHSVRWGSYVSAEHYRQYYRHANHAQRHDGQHGQLAAGTRFRITPQQTVFAHLSLQKFKPKHREWAGRENNAAYTRHSLGVGWQAHWRELGGLQTQFQAAFAQRQYKGVALNERFFWQPQRNRERVFNASLAHDKVQYVGLMPKLVWEYSRTNSSHAWARRKQKQLFIEIVKQF